MDFRRLYEDNRNKAIECIKTNIDIINKSLIEKPLYGYLNAVEEWCDTDMDCELTDDSIAYRKFIDPITIHSITDDGVMGYSSIKDNIGYGELAWYSLQDLNIDTIIQLTERI